MKIRNIVLFVILCVSSSMSGMAQLEKRPINRKDILPLLVGLLLFPMPYSTISHELGHALTNKILNGGSIEVYIGINNEAPQDYLLKLGGLAIHNFDFMLGTTRVNDKNIIKYIITLLSGPISGIMSLLLIKKIINKLGSNIRNPRIELLCFFYNLICNGFVALQILEGFTPISGAGSDGYKIFKNLGVSEKCLNRLFIRFDRRMILLLTIYMISNLYSLNATS